MPEFVPQFDKDLQKDILLVRDWNSTKKYSYSSRQGFTEVEQSVNVQDLIPLYMTKCSCHQMVFFCKNLAKKKQIFKYAHINNKFNRVQCICCEYDKDQIGTYVRHDGKIELNGNFRLLNHLMMACLPPNQKFSFDDLVEVDLENYIRLRPLYSDVCKKTNGIVVFAMEKEKIQAYNFDSSEKGSFFRLSDCECTKCTSTRTILYNTFAFGAQGPAYRRTHRDQNGLPLLCLSMTWHTEKYGVMDIFLDSKGNIGKYKYNYTRKCFDLVKLMEIRVQEAMEDERITRKRPQLLWDNELYLHYMDQCKTLNRPIFYANHEKDKKIRKYTFNIYTHQFELIKCSDCKFDASKVLKHEKNKNVILGIFKSDVTGRNIILKATENGNMCKEFQTIKDKSYVVGEKAPIRYLAHLNAEELLNHYTPKSKNDSPIQYLEANEKESWITTGYLKDSNVFLTGMDGQVKLYKIEKGDVEKGKFDLVEDPDAKYTEPIVKKNELEEEFSGIQNGYEFPSEEQLCEPQQISELLPYFYTYCNHFKRMIIFAYVGIYGRKRLQLILTSDCLVQVQCSCEYTGSRGDLNLEGGFKFASDGEFVYEMNKSMIQKMEYDHEKMEYKIIKIFEIRLLKDTPNRWENEEMCGYSYYGGCCCGPRLSLTEMVAAAVAQHNMEEERKKRVQEEKERTEELKKPVELLDDSEKASRKPDEVKTSDTSDFAQKPAEKLILKLESKAEEVNHQLNNGPDDVPISIVIKSSDNKTEETDDVAKPTIPDLEPSELSDDSDYSYVNEDEHGQQSAGDEPENQDASTCSIA